MVKRLTFAVCAMLALAAIAVSSVGLAEVQ